MEWTEKTPTPSQCRNCREFDCYHSDHAGQRWVPSNKEELLFRRALKLCAIARLQRQVEEIDQQLRTIDNIGNTPL